MRRGLPWALLGLVGLAAGLGAGLGLAGAPAGGPNQAWVAQVLATTRDAGTVRFTFSGVTTSPNHLLRATHSGWGAADFASGSARATEISRQTSLSSDSTSPPHPSASTQQLNEVSLRHSVYLGIHFPGHSQIFWSRFGPSHLGSRGALGLDYTSASGALGALSAANRVVQIDDLGPQVTGGVATTEYRVLTQPVCEAGPGSPSSTTNGPTDLWLDGDGRLVQARGVSYSDVRAQGPSAGRTTHAFDGRSTTTEVVRFHDFGVPLHITAPHIQPRALGNGSIAFSTLRAQCSA